MSHTPGPWTIRELTPTPYWASIGNDTYSIASVQLWSYGEPGNPVESAANARLIAAAPEMLKVLKEISEWADDRIDIDWNGQPNNAMEVWGMLGDIIAKAEGSSNESL